MAETHKDYVIEKSECVHQPIIGRTLKKHADTYFLLSGTILGLGMESLHLYEQTVN